MKIAYILVLLFVVLTESASARRAPANGSTFQIMPYLFSIKGEKIAVAWSYPNIFAITDKVVLTLKTGSSTKEIIPENDGDLFFAQLPIAVCDFGENISYRVMGMTSYQAIKNIPCPGHKDLTTRFVFMADTQEGTQFAHEFALQAANYEASAILIGGDLVQNGSEYGEWKTFFNAMNPAFGHQVLIPAVGNHEYRTVKSVPLWKIFFRTEAQDAFYSVDIGDAHVIALNSCFEDDPSQRLRQLAWLNTELAKPAKWKIVFFHHPAYSKGIFGSDHYPKKEYLVLQKDYIPLFEEHGVDLVLNGHTHIFERSYKSGINYVTTGPAGGSLGLWGGKNPYSIMSDRIRTMVELEVSSQALRVVTTTIDGRTIDEFVVSKDNQRHRLP